MPSSLSTIRVSGLEKSKLAALRAQARILGMSPEDYAKHLLEEGVALDQRARATTFDELFAGVQEQFRRSGMSEEELDQLVDTARTRHHRRTSKKRA